MSAIFFTNGFNKSDNIRKYISALSLVLLLAFFGSQNVNAQNFATSQLSITTASNTHDFNIELAENDSQRAYGLMFRNELPENNGMLFIYDQKRMINMWMKNTFISLDILFIDEEGKIMRIEKSAQPMSLSRISSGGPAKAVLELNGGITDQLDIKPGDQINYSVFEK